MVDRQRERRVRGIRQSIANTKLVLTQIAHLKRLLAARNSQTERLDFVELARSLVQPHQSRGHFEMVSELSPIPRSLAARECPIGIRVQQQFQALHPLRPIDNAV